MSVTMTEMIRKVQRDTGFPRFKFMSVDDIRETILMESVKTFTHYFPYKSYFTIRPDIDSVDPQNYPGLMQITPDDAEPEKIYDVGMCFSSNDIAAGGYPRDLGRTVYGGQMSIGALMYNQLNINMMSITQPQQLTCEYIQPNLVQFYPKQRFRSLNEKPIIIELMLYHSDDLRTIPNSYEQFFRKLCVLDCKKFIYDKYKDMDDETYAGHQIRTKIQDYADAESKIEDLCEKMDEESFKNPDRIDFFVV